MAWWLTAVLISASVLAHGDNRRVLKEAENLTLLQDRQTACAVIYKAYKKNPSQELKEKLFYFSKYFYTEKGFQNYSEGKELFTKEKYPEAQDKLSDADELEKSNADVLHRLALASMWNRKTKVALEATARARLINPLDTELLRDKLAIEYNAEDWTETLATAEQLENTYKDNSAMTQYMKAVALLKTDKKEDAEEALFKAQGKDKKYPEIFYWLSELEDVKVQKDKFLVKYNELCKNKKLIQNERDMSLCTRAQAKEK